MVKRKWGYLGAVSGGTLGYIAGNVPGAVAGARYGYAAGARRDARVPVNKMRRLTQGTSGTRMHANYQAKNSRSRANRNLIRSLHPAVNVRAKGGIKRGKSVKREGRRRKKVFVSKSLRKKIKKVMGQKEQYGWYIKRACLPLYTLMDDQQNVGAMGAWHSQGQYQFFDPSSVLDAASILFNKKGQQASVSDSDTDNFQKDTLKIRVIDSSVKFYMRNNTARTVTIKLWDYSPKHVGTTALLHQDWVDALAFTKPVGSAGAAGTLSNQNPIGVTVNVIGASPKHLQQIKNLYSIDETIFTLEAGKEYVHTLTGPKDKMYDFSKFYDGAVFQNAQKMVKGCLIALYSDVTSLADGRVGRYTDIDAKHGIVCETVSYIKVAMPEQAGFSIPLVAPLPGDTQQLTSRKDNVFAIYNANAAQGAQTVVYVVDESAESMQVGSG